MNDNFYNISNFKGNCSIFIDYTNDHYVIRIDEVTPSGKKTRDNEPIIATLFEYHIFTNYPSIKKIASLRNLWQYLLWKTTQWFYWKGLAHGGLWKKYAEKLQKTLPKAPYPISRDDFKRSKMIKYCYDPTDPIDEVYTQVREGNILNIPIKE